MSRLDRNAGRSRAADDRFGAGDQVAHTVAMEQFGKLAVNVEHAVVSIGWIRERPDDCAGLRQCGGILRGPIVDRIDMKWVDQRLEVDPQAACLDGLGLDARNLVDRVADPVEHHQPIGPRGQQHIYHDQHACGVTLQLCHAGDFGEIVEPQTKAASRVPESARAGYHL